jgi:hypothetical protein
LEEVKTPKRLRMPAISFSSSGAMSPQFVFLLRSLTQLIKVCVQYFPPSAVFPSPFLPSSNIETFVTFFSSSLVSPGQMRRGLVNFFVSGGTQVAERLGPSRVPSAARSRRVVETRTLTIPTEEVSVPLNLEAAPSPAIAPSQPFALSTSKQTTSVDADRRWAKEFVRRVGKGQRVKLQRRLSVKKAAAIEIGLQRLVQVMTHGDGGDAADKNTERRAIRHAVAQKIAAVTTSHRKPLDKCLVLLQIYKQLIRPLKVQLPASAYEEYFHAFATATLVAVGEEKLERQMSRLSGLNGNHSLLGSRIFSSQTLQEVWEVYMDMQARGVQPTDQMLVSMMNVLAHSTRGRDVGVEAKAHALMMEAARYQLHVDEKLLMQYTLVCNRNNAMHIAVGYYADFAGRLEQQPSSSFTNEVLKGLLANDQIAEALRFISTMGAVPVSNGLLKNMLVTYLRAGNPGACFSAYKAFFGKGQHIPSLEIMQTLCKAMSAVVEPTEKEPHLYFILQQLAKYRIGITPSMKKSLVEALHGLGREDLAQRILHGGKPSRRLAARAP